MMINSKRVVEMTKKWRKVASVGRKRISLPPRTDKGSGVEKTGELLLAAKGHFVVYTADKRRFVIPLTYLNSNIFRELFRMSEEEFGLPRNGPITLPCDAAFMEYVVSLVQGHASKDLEKALLISMDAGRFSAFSSHPLGQTYQQQLRCF
ncbi:PREDICTED: auxin-responsive protein SAUR64-like [Nelumbo nucifera]|uniref:Auxin-responsive protein SAUR64-like n=1 Tax=Nelumbo nucifera TaxID=4432 RepID=A0A1U8ASP1_NELNU|nr:PREDICTED: auxin-responsive protein SAUR64-like [Nelumbo nucifera]